MGYRTVVVRFFLKNYHPFQDFDSCVVIRFIQLVQQYVNY